MSHGIIDGKLSILALIVMVVCYDVGGAVRVHSWVAPITIRTTKIHADIPNRCIWMKKL